MPPRAAGGGQRGAHSDAGGTAAGADAGRRRARTLEKGWELPGHRFRRRRDLTLREIVLKLVTGNGRYLSRQYGRKGVRMTKIDIISGFLGAGKTTFIKKLLEEAIAGEKVVLIENEFGEIGIDGGFLQDSGIEIREMNSGCICCSLVGDFGRSLNEVLTKYAPDRVIIEPSGVGKLSDVMKAVCDVAGEIDVTLNGSVTVVDAQKCKMYMKNFGEFFNNQIESAGTIVLSRTDVADADKVAQCVELLREKNPKAAIVTTPIKTLTGAQLLEIIEKPADDMAAELLEEVRHHHHHHDEDEECGCGHEHHHHHDEDEECGCGHEHHHHHHDEDEECGCGHEHHHHHHDEDEECGAAMSIIITMMRSAAAVTATTTIITMVMTRTKCLPAGVWKPAGRFPEKSWNRSCMSWRIRTGTARCCGRRECFRTRKEPGIILTWFRRKPRSGPERRFIRARCA